MRVGDGDPQWLLGDHLGSTSVTANFDGSVYNRMGFMPFGEQRFGINDSPTEYQFTGQFREKLIGLDYFNAKWYDSYSDDHTHKKE